MNWKLGQKAKQDEASRDTSLEMFRQENGKKQYIGEVPDYV